MSHRLGSRGRGTALVLTSATAFGFMPILTKLAYDRGMVVSQLMPVRFWLAAAGLVVLAAIVERRRMAMTVKQISDSIILGIIFAIQAGAFLLALQFISASGAVLLLFTFPMIIAIAGWIYLGRTPTLMVVAALLVGFIGLCLAVGPSVVGSLPGVVLALVSASFNAFYFLYAESRLSTAPTLTVCALGLLTCAVAYSLIVAASGEKAWPSGHDEWLLLLGLVAAPLVGLPTLLLGVVELGAVSSSVMSAWEPIVSVGAAVTVLSEPLSPAQILGAALVVTSVVLAQLGATSPSPVITPPE